MLFDFALIIIGIALLVWSADRFTDGAAAIARNFGISPLIVGLTIVAIGSSAPEIGVSITATLTDNPQLAIGNAIGSNITNIALVLGITSLVIPLHVQSNTIRREFPLLFGVMLLAFFLIKDFNLSELDAVILLITLIAYVGWLIKAGLDSKNSDDLMLEELVEELPDTMPNGKAIFWIVVGIILLPYSAGLLVDGAGNIAKTFGVSDLVIGLTIVAIGTSLPELAASIAGVLKNEHELAIGNVIGSNIFNILVVMSIPGFANINFKEAVIYRDYLFMTILSLLMLFMAYGFRGPGKINRWNGAFLVLLFVSYQLTLFFSN
jgi:cation:H+ antiporter